MVGYCSQAVSTFVFCCIIDNHVENSVRNEATYVLIYNSQDVMSTEELAGWLGLVVSSARKKGGKTEKI